MRLHVTKQAGKYHAMRVERADGSSETLSIPEQRILPHDLVHFGVEAVLSHRGFLSMVASGDALDFATVGGDGEEAIERLVEAFQSALWSGGGDAGDIRYAYEIACEARGNPALPVSDADIEAIGETLASLGQQWAALAVGETLTLDFRA